MKIFVTVVLIVVVLLYGTWKYYEPIRTKMTNEPAAFLMECYKNEDKDVKSFSRREFEDNFYMLQLRDWCYEEYLKRMDVLLKRIEVAKAKEGPNHPHTQELLRYYRESEAKGPSIRDFWISTGWRGTLIQK